jgi:hypothetical protein
MKRRVIVALCTAAPVLAGTVAFAIIGNTATTTPQAPADPGQVNTVALRDVSSAKPSAPAKHVVKGLPAEATKPFSLLGVSWDDARAKLDGTVQVRTRSAAAGTWSSWRPVDAQIDELPDPGATTDRMLRGATSPLWVGPSNGVEVRVTGKGSTLPRGLRVELVDPGAGPRKPGLHAEGPQAGTADLGDVTLAGAVSTTDTTSPSPDAPSSPVTDTPSADPSASPSLSQSTEPTPSTSPSATVSPSASASPSPSSSASPSNSPTPTPTPTSTALRPTIISRAGWDADESIVRAAPKYGAEVKVVFVHHTDGANDYTCDESPAIIRSIMLYHVKTLGWDDIGYNFLVDKCGTIYEGRAGGVDKAVVGAHTYGFNTNSTGVAVLGNFVTTAPAQESVDAIARLAAWKLGGVTRVDPTGTTTLSTPATDAKFPPNTPITFNRISGHRDAYATECPGQKLYDLLGTIRTQAGQLVPPVTSVSLTSLTGATKVGTTYYTKGTITLGWSRAPVSRYEVLIDGAVVAKPDGAATSASVTPAAGSHKVQLRAYNINGTTVTSATYAVVVDKTAPSFSTAPYLAIRTGTVSTTGTIPVGLHWKVSDNTLLRSLKITSPSAVTLTTTATSWASSTKTQTSKVWSVAAADAAGNAKTFPITRTAALLYESYATRTGKWGTTTSSSYLGGKALFSSTKGSSATYTFTGRSVGLIVKRATNVGAFYVYVDGVKTALVDTRASSTAYRNIVWTKTWTTSAKHTVKIVVAGTSGRPTIATDGIAYVK